MVNYDIHTHHSPVHPADVAIVNRIVGEELPVSMCSYGIHPWYIHDLQNQLSELRRRAIEADVVAIGEAGFDRLAVASPYLQQEAFIAQARLAEEVHKPLIVHCVKAWDELIVAHKAMHPSVPWIIHGFRGNALLTAQLIRQGLLLSFGMHYNEEALRVAWPASVFVETDDKEVDIRVVYARVAASLRLTVEEVGLRIQENSLRIFPFLIASNL